MTQTEIRAEVFKIIRANDITPPKQLWILIKEHLPDVPNKELSEALVWLYERTG